MTPPGRQTGTGYARARIDAKLAWGIDLHAVQPGQVHESIAGTDLTDPFTERPDLDAVVAVEPHGRERNPRRESGGHLIVISRTLIFADCGLDDIPAAITDPSTPEETAAARQALNHLGYTGPRLLRLVIAPDRA
jgi:hypothetical protein